MPRNNYNEPKQKKYFTLTETAINWLRGKQHELKADSLSDTIERLAREETQQ